MNGRASGMKLLVGGNEGEPNGSWVLAGWG